MATRIMTIAKAASFSGKDMDGPATAHLPGRKNPATGTQRRELLAPQACVDATDTASVSPVSLASRPLRVISSLSFFPNSVQGHLVLAEKLHIIHEIHQISIEGRFIGFCPGLPRISRHTASPLSRTMPVPPAKLVQKSTIFGKRASPR